MFDLLKSASAKYRPQNVVVLDFGSTSSKAAILDLTTFRPTLLGLGEESYKSSTILSGLVADLDDFLLTVRNSVRKASFSCGFTPKDFVFSLSGEFVKTVTVDLKIRREFEGIIKGPEESRILKEIARLVSAEVAAEFPKITGDPDPEFKLIEKRILGLETLANVRLENLNSVLEKDFKATVLVSFVSQQTDKLLSRIASDLKRNLLFKTSQMANIVGLMKRSTANLSGVLVDYGGQVTDVCLVLNGRIIGTRSIPLGGRDITLELSEKLKITQDLAEETKLRGDFSRDNIADYLSFWIRSLDASISDICGSHSFPPVPVYLFGRSSLIPYIKELQVESGGNNGRNTLRGLVFKDIDQKIIRDAVAVKDEHLDGFEPLLATGAQILENYVSNEF